MLSIEHQQVINGITVYRDFQDPNQYYYLPSEKARIAENGKGIQFVAYIDGEVVTGTDPDFSSGLERSGGFLTLEVELGPTETELENVRSKIEGAGDGVRLAQAPFTDGAVKLVMFGSTGSTGGAAANSAVNFTVAGSAKPSLLGKQTAVFSLQLGGKEAQIMWNLLKKGSQTQVAVVYDLEYLGVLPAYNLEITVDFKATEDYWQHHIDLDFGLERGDLKIVSNNDVDIIMRDLVNTGAITVKAVNYSGGTDTILGADDPTGMKLVRELLSPTLFTATAIPSQDYNVLTSTLPSPTPTPSSSTPRPTPTPTPTPTSPTPTTPSPTTPTPSVTETPTPPSNDGGTTPIPPPTTQPPPRQTTPPPTSPPPTTPPPTTPPPTTPPPTTPPPTTPPPTTPPPTTPPPTTPPPDEQEKVETKININAGYTMRHRSVSERVKRTFSFNKAEAKINKYHPSGALSVEGTAFDATKQVELVRLGEGPFKHMTIEVRSALDFEAYQIVEAIVHISYGFAGANGDKTKRLHEKSIVLNLEKQRDQLHFFVDEYRTLTYDYYVEFIHKASSIIGSHETKIKSRVFENVAEKAISVNISDHSPLVPVEIQPGNIQFSNEGIQSVQVFVAPIKTGNGRTIIFKDGEVSLKKFLIYPAVANKYEYYLREQFFFADDTIEEEAEAQKDAQVIVNRPASRMLTIAPILVNRGNLISKAIVEVSFTNLLGEEFKKSLVLTPSAETTTQPSFDIVTEENEPRIWFGTTQFILTNGEIIQGNEIEYRTEQPPISLESAGLRMLQLSTLLGEETFAGTIAAIEVQILEPGNETPVESVLLKKSKPEQMLILRGVLPGDPLTATAKVLRKDGTEETVNYTIPANLDEFQLRITNP